MSTSYVIPQTITEQRGDQHTQSFGHCASFQLVIHIQAWLCFQSQQLFKNCIRQEAFPPVRWLVLIYRMDINEICFAEREQEQEMGGPRDTNLNRQLGPVLYIHTLQSLRVRFP